MKVLISIIVFTVCYFSSPWAMGSKPAGQVEVIRPSLEIIGASMIQDRMAYFSEMYPSATETHLNLVSIDLDSRIEHTATIVETCQFPKGQTEVPINIHSISMANQNLILFFTACWNKQGVMAVNPATLQPIQKVYLNDLKKIVVSGDSVFALSSSRNGHLSPVSNVLNVFDSNLNLKTTRSFVTSVPPSEFQSEKGRIYFSLEPVELDGKTVSQFFELETGTGKSNLLFQETCCSGSLYFQPRMVDGALVRTYTDVEGNQVQIKQFDVAAGTDRLLKVWTGVPSENPYLAIRVSLSSLYLNSASRIFAISDRYRSNAAHSRRLVEMDSRGNLLGQSEVLPDSLFGASILLVDAESIFLMKDNQVSVFKRNKLLKEVSP